MLTGKDQTFPSPPWTLSHTLSGFCMHQHIGTPASRRYACAHVPMPRRLLRKLTAAVPPDFSAKLALASDRWWPPLTRVCNVPQPLPTIRTFKLFFAQLLPPPPPPHSYNLNIPPSGLGSRKAENVTWQVVVWRQKLWELFCMYEQLRPRIFFKAIAAFMQAHHWHHCKLNYDQVRASK